MSESDPGTFRHRPVMLDKVVELLGTVPPGVVIDATLGGGGHSEAILTTHPHLTILGLDRDEVALKAAARRLEPHGARAVLVHTRFDALDDAAKEAGHAEASGALFDLGVSSPQLDAAERGFSYRRDGPLDMRMDRTTGPTAAELIDGLTVDELAALLRRYGDERHADRIARAVVGARPLATTGELADVIRNALPAPVRRRSGGDPARRSFQAIRIAVNDELSILRPTLERAIDLLTPGGRCVVLSYHSGEDRIVKDTFRHAATGGCECPPALPCGCGATPTVRLLRAGAWKPDANEVMENPRAESARLRAVEKIGSEEVAA